MKKTIIISGVTSGIGKGIAEHLHKQGHHIIGMVRVEQDTQLPYLSSSLIVDFESPHHIEKNLNFNNLKIDAFINCAAILPGKNILETNYTQLQRLFNINVISPMLIIKKMHPYFNASAVIILFGSISGQKGSYDDPYAASKGAIHSLVKSLSLTFAPKLRVIGVAPGITDHTRMTDHLIPGRYEENLSKVPLKKAGLPSDYAHLIEFLISPYCQFITGATIDINGGQYLR